MNWTDTSLPGVMVLQSPPREDLRGAFARLFCERELAPLLGNRHIVQINRSTTRAVGAIRGMHFQHPPAAETKIVQCLQGRVFDVAVDLRRDSLTFLQWTGCELTPGAANALFIPEGFAHGFQVLDENSALLYMHTAFYDPALEGAVRFDDPRVGVRWPLPPTDMSERDAGHPVLLEDFSGVAP